MEQLEKLEKLRKLQALCLQEGISLNDLSELHRVMATISKELSHPIYYEDGTISKQIDLSKTPLAIKAMIKYNQGFWVSLKTSPSAMNSAKFDDFLQTLPQISNNPWRIAGVDELAIIIDRDTSQVLGMVRDLFGLPQFSPIIKDEKDIVMKSCFASVEREVIDMNGLNPIYSKVPCYDKIIGQTPYYSGAYWYPWSQDSEFLVWPVCDLEEVIN